MKVEFTEDQLRVILEEFEISKIEYSEIGAGKIVKDMEEIQQIIRKKLT